RPGALALAAGEAVADVVAEVGEIAPGLVRGPDLAQDVTIHRAQALVDHRTPLRGQTVRQWGHSSIVLAGGSGASCVLRVPCSVIRDACCSRLPWWAPFERGWG